MGRIALPALLRAERNSWPAFASSRGLFPHVARGLLGLGRIGHQRAVMLNRQRVRRQKSKRLQRLRSERCEQTFAQLLRNRSEETDLFMRTHRRHKVVAHCDGRSQFGANTLGVDWSGKTQKCAGDRSFLGVDATIVHR